LIAYQFISFATFQARAVLTNAGQANAATVCHQNFFLFCEPVGSIK